MKTKAASASSEWDKCREEGISDLYIDIGQRVEASLLESGVNAKDALEAAMRAVDMLLDHWGGQVVYLGKGHLARTLRRHRLIQQEFTGSNHAELARRHGVGLQQVYKIVSRHKMKD